MAEFKFDDMESITRNRQIEREGTEIELPGDRVLVVRAASDANPAWAAQTEAFSRELRKLIDAKATPKRIRAFVAPKMAELLVADWRGVKSNGVEIPYSVEACTAFLLQSDDAYAAVDDLVWSTKNFRTKRVQVIVDEAKN